MRDTTSIAVVGASANPTRASHEVYSYLVATGAYRVYPVNPTISEIDGAPTYPTLAELPEPVDLVDVFRDSNAVPPIAEEAIAIGARCLWLQLGVSHPAAEERARAAGLMVVADRCVKIEHARLFGGLGWAGVDTKVISSHRPQNLPY